MPRDQRLDRVIIREDLDPVAMARLSTAFQRLFQDSTSDEGVLAQLVARLPLAALAIDADGLLTVAHGSALDRLGLGDGELVGTGTAAWGPEATTLVEQVRDGQAHVFDLDGASDADSFRFRVFGVPDGQGGSFALLLDLSDALVAEREVNANRAMLESAIEGSGAWMLVQDSNGLVLGVNDRARHHLHIERGAFDLRTSLARLDPVREDGERFSFEEFPGRAALRTGVPQRNVLMGLLIEGERRWLSASAVPITLDGANAVVTSFVDVTERHPTVDLLRDSEDRFRLLAEEAPLAIFVVGLEGQMLYVNPAAEEIAGRPLREIREQGWLALMHPDDQERLAGPEAQPDLDAFAPVEYRLLRPDGSMRWVRASGAALHDADGTVIGLVGTATDVTELRLANDRIRESEERTRAILETAAEGIVSCNEQGLILEFNAAAERIFGYDSDAVIERSTILDLLAPPDREIHRRYLTEYIAGGPPRLVGQRPQEVSGLRQDGTLVPIEMAVTEIYTSEGRLFTAVMRDLTEQKAFELELEHLATHDSLTGLPNRALLTAQLETALARADRLRLTVAVLFVEIDRVKLVTEALGHRAGDELIEQAAERLRIAAGPTPMLARFSNDQFVVVIEDLEDAGDAVETAIRVIESINEPFLVAADEAFVTASVGIAFAVEGLGRADVLVSNADVAMGRAKSSSITRYEVFDSEMRGWVEGQRKTEIALRHGIEREEFELFYQPVVELDTSEVVGYEALVRWNHPELGLLPPSEFIPVAEDSGLIVALGERILREAIRQSAIWRAAPRSSRSSNVAINLSARQLDTPGLVDAVRHALVDFDADPAQITFEITETVVLNDVETVVHTLTDLKRLGVRLSLDDFGTGYSSLTYLCRLPIDTVKVDRSFISQLGTATRDASIVEMVIAMARTLQLDVVAEGVETAQQAEVLRGWGCRYAQGYLFARPQPVADLDI